ncbi:MAG: hypothetical protein ACI9AR_000503 [Flavobacteriaceae bacterium]|jgi:hypothetical protein
MNNNTNVNISIKKAFSFGLQMFKKNWKIYVPFTIILAFISMMQEMEFSNAAGRTAFAIATVIASLLLGIALIKGFLAHKNKEVISLGDFKITGKDIKRYVGLNLIYLVVVLLIAFAVARLIYPALSALGAIGMVVTAIAIVIALIYLVLKSALLQLTVLDKIEMSFFKSLKYGWNLTKGSVSQIFSFIFLAGLLNIAGSLLFGIGLIVTIPITGIALVYIYKQLSGTVAEVEDISPTAQMHIEE